MGGRGAFSKSSNYTNSKFNDMGLVPLIVNNTIGTDNSYQGKNMGSGRARDNGSLSDSSTFAAIDNMLTSAPKIRSGAPKEIEEQLHSVTNGKKTVTVYRATNGNSINHGDWVFLSEAQADAWSRGLFNKTPKDNYKVIKAELPVSRVGWTGKNLEFIVY